MSRVPVAEPDHICLDPAAFSLDPNKVGTEQMGVRAFTAIVTQK